MARGRWGGWKFQLTEKSVGKRDAVDALHLWIVQKVWIYEEEHWHIDLFSSVQFLFYPPPPTTPPNPPSVLFTAHPPKGKEERPTFKAKTLDLRKIRRNLSGTNAIRRHANDILLAHILSFIERQRGLSRQHPDLALLRGKFPVQHVGDGRVERDAQATGVRDGNELFGGEASLVGDGRAAEAGSLADCAVEGDGRVA